MLLNWFFHLGRVPSSERKMLDLEGIRLSCEGISGSFTYKNYRTAEKCAFLRKRLFLSGALAVTRDRLVAYGHRRRIINLLFADGGQSRLKIHVAGRNRLFLSGDASDFGHDHPGKLEFRFAVPGAEKIARLLKHPET